LPVQRKRTQRASHSVGVDSSKEATEVPAQAAFARSGLRSGQSGGVIKAGTVYDAESRLTFTAGFVGQAKPVVANQQTQEVPTGAQLHV
jgi:hypothetical protein